MAMVMVVVATYEKHEHDGDGEIASKIDDTNSTIKMTMVIAGQAVKETELI